ncbi:protein of unknown function [Pontibacter chinhatensis]|uniref:DUF4249 domain-containing protein n=2 Tax=Pontibacter chinhatensis TaxID=1436961 RepID=A0A1I2TCW2_9BACT|nr:protein of unknown function [Pontibacter chinhatensis]
MRGRTEHSNWLWSLLLLLGLQACVEPFELETGGEDMLLVVDGLITDQNRPDLNKVTLSWTAPFDSKNNIAVIHPVVEVRDAQGQAMRLTEGKREVDTSRGVYTLEESEFKAVAGKSYSLHVRLADGREYASRPELLTPVPPIQSVNYEFKEFINVVENSDGKLVEKRTAGFEVKVRVQDPEEQGNFYRWDTEGVFAFFTKGPGGRTSCWANVGSINTRVAATDDRLTNGRLFEHPVAIIPADIPTMYRIRIRQYSLTAEAYEFWRLLNEQQSNVGSIFDPPPAQIKGNLYSTTDPEERVFGYFTASALTEDYKMVPRYLYAPFPGPPWVLPEGDCRYTYLYPDVTDEKPEGF